MNHSARGEHQPSRTFNIDLESTLIWFKPRINNKQGMEDRGKEKSGSSNEARGSKLESTECTLYSGPGPEENIKKKVKQVFGPQELRV